MKLWKVGAGVAIAVAATTISGSGPALAQDFSITIPKETDRATVGSVIPIYSEDVPDGFEGQTCTVSSTDVSNNPSIHDNDLIVTSENSITISDIEDGLGTKSAGGLLLGKTVSFSVAINNTDASDNGAIDPVTSSTFPPNTGTFSAALLVEFECDPPPPPPTDPPPTDPPPTDPPPTDPPPTDPHPTDPPPTDPPPTDPPPTDPPPTDPPSEEPELAFEFLGPVCVSDHPFINYSMVGDVDADDTATITITDINGDVVQVLTGQPLSGQIIWPGASVDPEDWPGWVRNADGVWVEDPTDEVLRSPLTVTVEVNPTAVGVVEYPPATEACADPPDDGTATTVPGTTTPPTTTPTTLPKTGSDATANGVLLAIMFLSAGGSIVLAARRRTT